MKLVFAQYGAIFGMREPSEAGSDFSDKAKGVFVQGVTKNGEN